MQRISDKPPKNLNEIPSPDEAVLNLLSRSNADLSSERTVYFYLYFHTEEKSRMAEMKLRELGFTIETLEPSGKKEWLCLIYKNVIPNSATLTSIRKKLEHIANKFDGNYDGWETGLDANEAEGLC